MDFGWLHFDDRYGQWPYQLKRIDLMRLERCFVQASVSSMSNFEDFNLFIQDNLNDLSYNNFPISKCFLGH